MPPPSITSSMMRKPLLYSFLLVAYLLLLNVMERRGEMIVLLLSIELDECLDQDQLGVDELLLFFSRLSVACSSLDGRWDAEWWLLFRPPREEFLRKKNLHDGDDGRASDDKQIEDGDVDAADRLAMTSTFELCREENTKRGRERGPTTPGTHETCRVEQVESCYS